MLLPDAIIFSCSLTSSNFYSLVAWAYLIPSKFTFNLAPFFPLLPEIRHYFTYLSSSLATLLGKSSMTMSCCLLEMVLPSATISNTPRKYYGSSFLIDIPSIRFSCSVINFSGCFCVVFLVLWISLSSRCMRSSFFSSSWMPPLLVLYFSYASISLNYFSNWLWS